MNDQKQLVDDVFSRAAPYYGQKVTFFDHFGECLVKHSAIEEGQTILDVATGRGAILFPAAERVGSTGQVVGIDLSASMIEQTANVASERGIRNVELKCMDAEQLDFPDNSFDHAFCGFALFFFPNLPQALSEFRRVLKPGGTLSVSIWGTFPELDIWLVTEAKKIAPLKRLDSTSFEGPNHLIKVLNEARFEGIEIFEENFSLDHASPEAWWESLWSHGMRSSLENLTPLQLRELQSRAFEKAKEINKGSTVEEKLQAFCSVAKTST